VFASESFEIGSDLGGSLGLLQLYLDFPSLMFDTRGIDARINE